MHNELIESVSGWTDWVTHVQKICSAIHAMVVLFARLRSAFSRVWPALRPRKLFSKPALSLESPPKRQRLRRWAGYGRSSLRDFCPMPIATNRDRELSWTLPLPEPRRRFASMSTVQEIKAAIPKLTPQEQLELKEWLQEFFEDQLELDDEVKTKLDQ